MTTKFKTAITLTQLESLHALAASRAKNVKIPVADLSTLMTAHQQLMAKLHSLGYEVV